MRFDTHRARVFVVNQLLRTPGIHDIHDDGTDIVLFRNRAGNHVMVHLFERVTSLTELRQLYAENGVNGIHTLPLYWADMMLPGHGQWYEADDWMNALLKLQRNWIYGYEVFGDSVYLFGVHFRKQGWLHEISHGPALDFRTLNTQNVASEEPPLIGNWYAVHFETGRFNETADPQKELQRSHLYQDFERLKLSTSATFAEVQQSYRQLARALHPDHNLNAAANEQMKLLNISYSRIRQFMWDQGEH
ncbi:MAG: J domain-containing protein [Chloroflexi bacterium]|nr:J domain-containing protein [Chloroflexota bacterium]